jgi:8-oxo-dGTP pyrophosphatase MutT (NUDIX family)
MILIGVGREPIPTWFFAVAVVRLGRRFLLVEERKHGGGWYLPAGRVEPGESLLEAAQRETLEEAGIRIRLTGVLRVEHSVFPDGNARVRAIFVGHPLDDTPPKAQPDEHTLRAAFVTLDEVRALELRGTEVYDLLAAVDAGAPSYPLDVLSREGFRWSRD